jgi:glycosyltransferase involved in cell wall biosynthesis
MIAELIARGHRVVAMAPSIDPEVAKGLRTLGAEPVEIQIANSTLNPLSLLASLRLLVRVFKEIRPDTVIPYTIKPVTIGGLAASRAGVPNIVPLITGLGYPFSNGTGLKRKLSRLGATVLYRLSLARSSTVIFQNKDDRDDLAAEGILPAGKRSVVVNGSGVDLAEFTPKPIPAKPSFLMIARLIGDKGVLEYGAAVATLKKKYPHARFALAGWFDPSPDGISKEELDTMVAGGVDYLGKLDDVRPALADAGVFVLPSRYREGTPRSSLEAMAMGRPVITCDAPGCRETVEQGENGFLVRPGDVADLTAAMERFIANPALIASMGPKSRALAERKFDVHTVNRAIIEAAGL